DPGALDTHTATIDWGDGTVEAGVLSEAGGTGTVTGSHAYKDDGFYVVAVRVTDDQGAKGSATFTVHVLNAPPSVTAGAGQPTDEGGPVHLTGAHFSDPGLLGTHTARINWGDGTPDGIGVLTGGTIQAAHVYEDNGNFLVTVFVTDDDGGVGSGTFHV